MEDSRVMVDEGEESMALDNFDDEVDVEEPAMDPEDLNNVSAFFNPAETDDVIVD
jgi:hypothetical protein